MTKENIICDDCGADFIIEYDTSEDLQYCPFCGGDLFMMVDDEEDDNDEYEEDEIDE